MKLIHPIYLDVPMLVSFAAALDGGVAFATEITKEESDQRKQDVGLAGGARTGNLLSSLFGISSSAALASSEGHADQEVRRELKAHTEQSIAILLYDKLSDSEALLNPGDADALVKVGPGDLVEVAGTIKKNAVDQLIDYADATDILSSLASQSGTSTAKRQTPKQPTPLRRIRDTLDADRNRTPISNAIMRCTAPPSTSAVVTLRRENLRDLTLSELHQNSVVVVGKVTRVAERGGVLGSFDNYGLSLLTTETLNSALTEIGSNPDVKAEFSEVEVQGPAVQLLPLMIFV